MLRATSHDGGLSDEESEGREDGTHTSACAGPPPSSANRESYPPNKSVSRGEVGPMERIKIECHSGTGECRAGGNPRDMGTEQG